MYFSNFPQMYYTFEINGVNVLKIVTDISANVRFRKEILAGITLYDLYEIRDGETPDILADRIYGSSQYHWVLLLVNEKYDIYNDWPLSYEVLNNYIVEKYTLEMIGDVHHYEKDGYIVLSDVYGATAVSNWDYEVSENDKKRLIKIVHPSLIKQLTTEILKLI